MLEIPLLTPQTAFVREGRCLSPLFSRPQADLDLLEAYFELVLLPSEDQVTRRFYRDYIGSTVAFLEYNGSYDCPEIWTPQATPAGKINLSR
jgi:hypothetical protein